MCMAPCVTVTKFEFNGMSDMKISKHLCNRGVFDAVNWAICLARLGTLNDINNYRLCFELCDGRTNCGSSGFNERFASHIC